MRLSGKTAAFISQGTLTSFKDSAAFFPKGHHSFDVLEIMTICRKNYVAEPNAINQREGLPVAAAFNLWHGEEFYFSCVTFLQSIHHPRVFM